MHAVAVSNLKKCNVRHYRRSVCRRRARVGMLQVGGAKRLIRPLQHAKVHVGTDTEAQNGSASTARSHLCA